MLSLHTILLLELVYTSSGIDKLLLTGIKRVARGANIEMQLFLNRRTGEKAIAAGAANFDFRVGGMDIRLHMGAPETYKQKRAADSSRQLRVTQQNNIATPIP